MKYDLVISEGYSRTIYLVFATSNNLFPSRDLQKPLLLSKTKTLADELLLQMKNELEQKRRLKKFFYLSAVCLFPGLGLLFGIVLLVYAVFIFKNIKLIAVILLAMAGGFGISKLDSAYLRHDMLYGKDSENAYSLLARNELDEIVRNLDLYRIRHQRYPDSLKQLEKDNAQLFIKDPLQARNHSRDPKTYPFVYFYYIPKDTAYELFSAGVDGIPHTQDDIYPQKPLR